MVLKRQEENLGFQSCQTNVSYAISSVRVVGIWYMRREIRQSTRVKFYHYMKNCNQNPTNIRESILKIVHD